MANSCFQILKSSSELSTFASYFLILLALLLYPEKTLEALEFEKIRLLLLNYCQTDSAKEKTAQLRFHTRLDYMQRELEQTHEFLQTLMGPAVFPLHFTHNIQRELKLLSLSGAMLRAEDLLFVWQLTRCIQDILTWFKNHNELYPQLHEIVAGIEYEKSIIQIIKEVIDDAGQVKDNASDELLYIRNELGRKRQTLRKVFDNILRKMAKQGYLADIAESFLNGRRTLAVVAEQKRVVKGILHGESDTGKTVFIEPEETIELNNDIVALERAELRELQRILAETTARLHPFATLLNGYYELIGVFDFIKAKALLAKELEAALPRLSPHPQMNLIAAHHPLLFLHNKEVGKPTVPLNLQLNRQHSILMISGPNAGGKTVAMKTAGLLQLMLQCGLLVPVDDTSEMGVFKQIMVHIGDTQSIENELSTYSAHLKDMKYFSDFANGKTLFFIDELGGGTDPNLGGSFAEAIVERLVAKKAIGIITTHYLNLKVMADKIPNIVNGAMTFDEKKLEPLYQLSIGKPGSSYTFSIAQRSGLHPEIIERARQLSEQGHFKLDKILHRTEQQSVRLGTKEQQLDKLLQENERLKEEYERLIDKERLEQHFATLKLQNKIKKEELDYLRDMERKFKQIIFDWKKTKDKQTVIQAAEKILFKRKAIEHNAAAAKKADKKYLLASKTPEVGDLIRNKSNHQVGRLIELKVKKAIVRIGKLPFTVDIQDWVVVLEKQKEKTIS